MRAVRTTRKSDRLTPEDHKPLLTQADLGVLFGVTYSRAQQLESLTFRKFRMIWGLWESIGWDESRRHEIAPKLRHIERMAESHMRRRAA